LSHFFATPGFNEFSNWNADQHPPVRGVFVGSWGSSL
jgi:hypothetical protein